MTNLLIQHGPAKGQKIENAIKGKNAYGAIFSLREEAPESIGNYIIENNNLNNNNSFIDPQFYYSTYDPSIAKYLENSLNFPMNVSRKDKRMKDPRINLYFNSLIDYVSPISDNIIVPGLALDSIDWKFDYTLDIYNDFQIKCPKKTNYMSLLISIKMFHSKNDIDEILLDIKEDTNEYFNKGIYLTINHETLPDINYESIDPETLSNILYFIYSLKKANFKIIVGYTFINSLLYAMLDVEYVSSGWFNNLRNFTNAKFENIDTFGRRKKKFFSIPLLSYIPLDTIISMRSYFDINLLKSNTKCDDVAFKDADNVSFVDLEHQYWEGLNQSISQISEFHTIENKISYLVNVISSSLKMSENAYSCLKGNGELQNLFKTYTSHLSMWLFAIELFIKKASIIID